MTPLASYRRLLSIAGPTYVLAAFVGRLPLAMSQLGTLLLVSTATGSYGLGGLSAGALAVANAVGAPIAGSLADRVGQRPVVLVQSLLGATGLATLVAVVGSGSTDAGIVLSAAATGLVLPQVGPLARVRWRPLTRSTGAHQRRLVDAAFSYEGAADEASFAIGPALVGLSVALVSPSGALLLAAVLLAVFGSAFALDPSARLAHELSGGGFLVARNTAHARVELRESRGLPRVLVAGGLQLAHGRRGGDRYDRGVRGGGYRFFGDGVGF